MRRILLVALMALPLCAMGQDLNIHNMATALQMPVKKQQSRPVATTKEMGKGEEAAMVVVEDTVYYRDLVRKYQWYEGRDSISKEVAYHLPCYFRFTMKNDAGHWQHVEAMCGDTMTTNHDISHYVLDKRFDSGVSESSKIWVKRLATVTQWFLTTGLDDNTVIEERAYDKNNLMVYSYLPTRNTNGRITACYNNDWGLPVDMAEDSLYTYGSVVYIAMDRCGRDSIIDFLDGQGLPKLNTNGVDQQRYKYDGYDRIIESSSHNIVGDRIMDNWGNHGNTYEYDDDGNYTITTIDKYRQPMQMPGLRADETRTYWKCCVTLDEYGRIAKREMLDGDGNPGTTYSGIYLIRYSYEESPDGHYLRTRETRYYDDGRENTYYY